VEQNGRAEGEDDTFQLALGEIGLAADALVEVVGVGRRWGLALRGGFLWGMRGRAWGRCTGGLGDEVKDGRGEEDNSTSEDKRINLHSARRWVRFNRLLI
jgi:hypothetical protein